MNTSRPFEVLLHNRARVEAGLTALAKKAGRKGLTPMTWSWGKAHTSREHVAREVACSDHMTSRCPGCRNVTRVPLILEGEAPHYEGWTFLAALQHLDGENLVRAVSDVEVPTQYRTRGPVCDHCKAIRRRHETYVLRHTDGRTFQVGSTCIDDFMGSREAVNLAISASLLSAARGLAEEGEEGFGGGGSSGDYSLGEVLGLTAWSVRETGWVSRKAAGERGEGTQATADHVWILLTNEEARTKSKADPTAEDVALATAAETWAESLSDEDVNRGTGDYLHNLRVIARTAIVDRKSIGIAASMIVAYQNHVARERARAERDARPTLDAYVGTVGKRETFSVVLDLVTGYDTAYGYTTICKFRTADGATLVWKASSTDLTRSDVGKAYTLTGSVKAHSDYKGAKQTLVTRCKAVAA